MFVMLMLSRLSRTMSSMIDTAFIASCFCIVCHISSISVVIPMVRSVGWLEKTGRFKDHPAAVESSNVAPQYLQRTTTISPHHARGADQYSWSADEDASQFDFYGSIYHASYMREGCQIGRRENLVTGSDASELVDFLLKSSSVLEIKSQSNSGMWPTGDIRHRVAGTTTGSWDTLLQNTDRFHADGYSTVANLTLSKPSLEPSPARSKSAQLRCFLFNAPQSLSEQSRLATIATNKGYSIRTEVGPSCVALGPWRFTITSASWFFVISSYCPDDSP